MRLINGTIRRRVSLTPFHSLLGTHGPCDGFFWGDDMRVEDDEFLWTINWCCNGYCGEENGGKKGVEEHDQVKRDVNYKR